MSNKTKELGPVYGVELIDSLPIPGSDGMRQALPSRLDLRQANEANGRLVAGYEVLLYHWCEQGKEIERLRELAEAAKRMVTEDNKWSRVSDEPGESSDIAEEAEAVVWNMARKMVKEESS